MVAKVAMRIEAYVLSEASHASASGPPSPGDAQLLYHRQICKKFYLSAGHIDLVYIVQLCAHMLPHRSSAANESHLDAQPLRSARKGFGNAARMRSLQIASRQSQRWNLKQIRKACLPGWMG